MFGRLSGFVRVWRNRPYGLGRLIVEVSRSHTIKTHTHTHISVPLNRCSGRRRDLYLHNTTDTTDEQPQPLRYSNPRSQQSSGRRPTPLTTGIGPVDVLVRTLIHQPTRVTYFRVTYPDSSTLSYFYYLTLI